MRHRTRQGRSSGERRRPPSAYAVDAERRGLGARRSPQAPPTRTSVPGLPADGVTTLRSRRLRAARRRARRRVGRSSSTRALGVTHPAALPTLDRSRAPVDAVQPALDVDGVAGDDVSASDGRRRATLRRDRAAARAARALRSREHVAAQSGVRRRRSPSAAGHRARGVAGGVPRQQLDRVRRPSRSLSPSRRGRPRRATARRARSRARRPCGRAGRPAAPGRARVRTATARPSTA